MAPKVISTNVAFVRDNMAGFDRVTGIDKRPAASIEVFAPGPNYGDGSGVEGDVIGDSKHHGGADKAVYAFAREELDYWGEYLGQPRSNGSFGENLTTEGVVWKDVLIGQKIHVGSAVLEVSVARRPCLTFARWIGVDKWVKTFYNHGDCGAYFRVITPGTIHPGDELNFDAPPAGDVLTMGEAFAAKARS